MKDPYFWLRVLENVNRENYNYHCKKKNCDIHDVCLASELKDKSVNDVNQAIKAILYQIEDELLKQL